MLENGLEITGAAGNSTASALLGCSDLRLSSKFLLLGMIFVDSVRSFPCLFP